MHEYWRIQGAADMQTAAPLVLYAEPLQHVK
jgi:hypothetical protein